MPSSGVPARPVIAFEVSKDTLVVHTLPEDRQFRIRNTGTAVRRLLGKLAVADNRLVICEATGGYERHVLEACFGRDLDVHRAHGSRTRAFATYLGLAAKTDALDARMLALYGQRTPNLRLCRRKDDQTETLRALRKRRDDLMSMTHMEENRLGQTREPFLRRSIINHVRAMHKERERMEAQINAVIAASPVLKKKATLITSIKGVGAITAQACLAYLPELGELTKGEAASLAGLAPIARDSGKFKGRRHIAGGRGILRSNLYMAALVAKHKNPAMRTFAENLKSKGKPNKVILTAIMRRLIVIINAVIKSGQPCRQNS